MVNQVDAETLQHYHKCYWAHFDPLFPIVHKQVYQPAQADPLLGAMILAIGAQFSSRSYSEEHSGHWFNLVSSMVSQTHSITISETTPLPTLQAILLWEYFSLYRTNALGVHRSAHFAALYSILLQTCSRSKQDVHAQAILANQTHSTTWIQDETRNRLLIACFILDGQRSTLFQQQVAQVLPSRETVPRPSPPSLWDGDAQRLIPGRITDFEVSLSQAFDLHLLGGISARNMHNTTQNNDVLSQTLQLATKAPTRALLVTAGEQLLFGRQVPDEEWRAARYRVRGWAASEQAPPDMVSAGKVLNTFFEAGEDETSGGLESDWCLYLATLAIWAFAHAHTPAPTATNPRVGAYSYGMALGTSSPLARMATTPGTPGGSGKGGLPVYGSASAAAAASMPAMSSTFPPSISAGLPGTATQILSLQASLDLLKTDDLAEVARWRGCRHVVLPVLKAVHNVLASGLAHKGALVLEAVQTLRALIDVDEGRRHGGLLEF